MSKPDIVERLRGRYTPDQLHEALDPDSPSIRDEAADLIEAQQEWIKYLQQPLGSIKCDKCRVLIGTHDLDCPGRRVEELTNES